MEFDPQPIKLKVANFFENKNELFLGKITTFSDDDFVKFTNKWVTEIDICLSKVIKYSPIYIELFTHRGFTYNEYLELFLNIDEGLYICFAAYEYFTILKKEQLFSIRSSLEASIAGYLKCIHKEFEKGCLNTLHSVYKSFSANITPKELQVHAYISGKTGSGKSELLKRLIYQLALNNNSSIVLIEPHNKLSPECLHLLYENFSERIIYLDPKVKDGYTPVINPLSLSDPTPILVDITAQNLTDTFCELFYSSDLSLNMRAFLIPCLSVLLWKKGATLYDLQKLIMGDEELLTYAIKNAKQHHLFFKAFNNKLYTTTKTALFLKIQSLLNFLSFSQCTLGENTIDLGTALIKNQIILCNFGGSEVGYTLGKFIISMIISNSMLRTKKRNQTYLFVDEAHNYVSSSFGRIIKEARKFKLSMIFCSQESNDFGKLEDSMLSNVSTIFSAANKNETSVKKVAKVSGIDVNQLHKLPNYHFHYNSGDKSFIFKVNDELVNYLPTLPDKFIEKITNNYRKTDVDFSHLKTKENVKPVAKFKL